MANPTTVEGLLSAVQNHGANHRSSLSAPVIPRTTGGAHVAFGPGHTPQPRYNRNRSISNGQYSVYGAFPHPRPVPWLNKLCHEPEGDISTCCLGYWLPCALYGNTQYRLKQMAQGDDPLDLGGLERNNGPCWMHQMLCFFFRCEWCVVMLQHSRIRATYNIDGTAGGDCVQSYYCPCCTLMQDEREVVGREQRILRQQKGDGDVTHQPGFEPQMRYSTSNLLEEIPDIFREHTGSYPNSTRGLISGQESTRESRRQSLEGRERDGGEDHEMQELHPFSLGHSDSDTSGIDEHRRLSRSRSRRSSNSSGKSRFRETSPLGSALNPITVSRSVSVDHGLQKPKPHVDVPQRSVTSPTRRRSLKDTNPPPASRNLNYRLKSITTDDRPEFLIETIKEGSESSNHAPTINSRAAVKSLAMDSLRSVASKNHSNANNTFPPQHSHKKRKSGSDSQDDLRSDEAYTTFYNDQGKMFRRRISDCLRPRASTPESPDIYQLHYANPTNNEQTIELKKALSSRAKTEEQERKYRMRLKLQTALVADTVRAEEGLGSPSVSEPIPAVIEGLPAGSTVVEARVLTKPVDKSISAVVTAATEKSGASDILSLPEGVNDADDLAMYLDQAVQDSGLRFKNQKSVDRSAMQDLAFGGMAPRKQTLRLEFNSEDEGSEPVPTAEQIAYGLDDGRDKTERVTSSCVSPQTIPEQGTGVVAVDRYPSYIVTSDGAASTPLDIELETPLDIKLDDGRMEVVKEFGHLTPRHKKSVSDWFKDIGRSNSNKSDKNFTVKIDKSEIPPVPILPAQFKEQGFSLGPLRSFSPLGFMSREKPQGKPQFSTMRSAQKLTAPEQQNRTVSAPLVPALPQTCTTLPLSNATNNAIVAENIMETQDKLQVLQDEFKLMAEEVKYEMSNQSPTPTPAAIGESWGVGDWLSPSSSTTDIPTSSKERDNVTPAKLKQGSFPLIKSDKSTPTSSLSEATATTFLVASDAIDIDHSRRGADTGNANVYSNKTLISTIKKLSSTPVYGTDSPTTFAQSLEDLGFDIPTNLETPSAIPEGFLEHMPGEFPLSPQPETPAALNEVVVEGLSPARYFPLIGTRSSSLKVEGSDDTASSTTESKQSDESNKSRHSGHIHEDQQIEVADQFSSSSAAAAMNTTCTARNMSGTLDGAKESNPFSHPFFSGTAIIDFALMNPKKLRDQLRMSDAMEGGSEETIRPSNEREVNPLKGVDGCMGSAEAENPLHAVDSESSVSGSILAAEDAHRTAMPALTPIAEASREVSVSTGRKPRNAIEVRKPRKTAEVLTGDDVTILQPPPDHPVTAERMDDAIAAITKNPRASSMHGALTKPIMEADVLRSVCDQMNRGALSYESEEEIITVGANGPITPRKVKSKKERRGSGLGHTSTVVRRSMSPERVPRVPSLGNARLHDTLEHEIGGTPKIVIGNKTISDKLIVSDNGVSPMDTSAPSMPIVSPKRVHSPAETKLREMLGKVTGSMGTGKGRDVDMKGDTVMGENGAGLGVVKKRNSKNSPQRRRSRAEKKRREREEGKVGK